MITLDAVVRRLAGQPASRPLLMQAYVQLGVALVALDQPEAARARFREALAIDPRLRLTPDQFSPKVIAVFEQAREGARAAARKEKAGGGHGKTVLLVGAGAAAVAVTAAVLAGGSKEPTATATVRLANARFSPSTIECPNGLRDSPIPVIVLVDATSDSATPLTVTRVDLQLRVQTSEIPGEVGFLSTRPSQAVPSTLPAGGTTTLRIASDLLCSNDPGGPQRFQEWTGLVTVTTSAGMSTAATLNLLHVDLP